jgi:biopolymer transport protein ExbD
MRRKIRQSLDDGEVEEPLINLTPLIDVVFVVLITFILVAPMLEIDSIDLAVGGAEKQEAQPSLIAISVKADNSIWMQGNNVSLAQLEQKLKLEKQQRPKAVPQVIQDSRASFGTYQNIKNTLEAVGFEQMDVVLKPGN